MEALQLAREMMLLLSKMMLLLSKMMLLLSTRRDQMEALQLARTSCKPKGPGLHEVRASCSAENYVKAAGLVTSKLSKWLFV